MLMKQLVATHNLVASFAGKPQRPPTCTAGCQTDDAAAHSLDLVVELNTELDALRASEASLKTENTELTAALSELVKDYDVVRTCKPHPRLAPPHHTVSCAHSYEPKTLPWRASLLRRLAGSW